MSKADIEVPSMVIAKDEQGNEWTLDDLKTLEDYDDAVAVLVDTISSIEFQLAAPPDPNYPKGPAWRAKARMVLSLRQAALEEVRIRRSRMERGGA